MKQKERRKKKLKSEGEDAAPNKGWGRVPDPFPAGCCQDHRYLGLGEAESRGQLHPFGRGEVALDLKPLLQTGELRVGENGAGFAAAAVLPGQLGVMLEEGWHRHSWGDTRWRPGLPSGREPGPELPGSFCPRRPPAGLWGLRGEVLLPPLLFCFGFSYFFRLFRF